MLLPNSATTPLRQNSSNGNIAQNLRGALYECFSCQMFFHVDMKEGIKCCNMIHARNIRRNISNNLPAVIGVRSGGARRGAGEGWEWLSRGASKWRILMNNKYNIKY